MSLAARAQTPLRVNWISASTRIGPLQMDDRAACLSSEGDRCFGGAISGRQIELVPGRRVVEAWRVGSWDEGVFSVVGFALEPAGGETMLVFDHVGFPPEESASGGRAKSDRRIGIRTGVVPVIPRRVPR